MKHHNLIFAFVSAIFLTVAGCASTTPLIKASKEGNYQAVQKLVQSGANINEADMNGATPLMHASQSGNNETVKGLLKMGADIKIKDKQGATALMYAIWCKKVDAAKHLIASGVDIKAKDNYGDALIYAVDYKQYELMNILIDKGADIESRDHLGNTPLVHAAWDETNIDAVKILIKRGADVNAKCANGETALDVALASTRGDLVDALGVNLWKPEAGKARLFFVGTVLFDYLKITVGEQTKNLNQNMYVGLAFIDVDSGKHSIDAKIIHIAASAVKQVFLIDVTAGQTYYFKVTQDMRSRAVHYVGIKLSSAEIIPLKEVDAKKEIKELLQSKEIK